VSAPPTKYNLFDPLKATYQFSIVSGFQSTVVEPVEMVWDELFTTSLVGAKKESLCVIPTLFKEDSVKWTKGGRPTKTSAHAFTALVFDLDSGDPQPEDIELFLDLHGIAGTYWHTWKSQPGNFRIRLMIPLDRPYDSKVHEPTWKFWARSIEKSLGLKVDWNPRHVTSLHALPSICTQKVGHDQWGGISPNPIHVEGMAMSLEEAAAKQNLFHYQNSLKKRRSGSPYKAAGTAAEHRRPPAPYKGDSASAEASEALRSWAENRAPTTPTSFSATMDALALLRANGLGSSRLGVQRGSRLYGAWWNSWRLGMNIKDILSYLDPAVEEAGSKYLREHLTHERFFSRREESECEWLAAVRGMGKAIPYQEHREAFDQYLRILSRAAHLNSEEGGRLCHAQISNIVGVHVKAVTLWRHQIIELGFLTQTGEKTERRYQRRMP
jgi:hypothetical protein